MSKKKGKNSNYSGKVDNKGLNYKKEPKQQTFLEKYKKLIIWSVCGVLLLALVTGIVFAVIPKKPVYVEMDFGSYGKIVIEVDRNEAPKTAKNFISLVNDGFYDGLDIFRAQKKFVIQGGKNESIKLDPIVGEFNENGHKNDISHVRGVISMARANDPDSATSQFFITLDDIAAQSLDGKYAGFGHVVEGMDVVDKIAEALFPKSIDSMGFVDDGDAITIVSAKVIEYKK